MNKIYFTYLLRGGSVCWGHCISAPSDSSSVGQAITRPLPASLSGGCCCRAATRVNGRYCRHSNLHVYIAPATDSIQWQPFSNLHLRLFFFHLDWNGWSPENRRLVFRLFSVELLCCTSVDWLVCFCRFSLRTSKTLTKPSSFTFIFRNVVYIMVLWVELFVQLVQIFTVIITYRTTKYFFCEVFQDENEWGYVLSEWKWM